ncbi:EthD family reductase [Hydrocarboniphaga effusa]|uniref:EthD family reductase n=1 Tax=Hydrocarboniphaga effusa TaxID=243629 RepID=UPI003BAB9719
MIKVTVLYPNHSDARFDFDYYLNRHLPDAERKLGASCRKVEVDQGLAAGAPGVAAGYVAITHLFFDSIEIFQLAFAPHAAAILADVPNFTNVEPVIQIGQVRR